MTKVDTKHIWHPFTSLQDKNPVLLVEKGEGANLILKDGTRIIDAVSSWWVNIHGHSNQELADVIYKQAKTLEHTIFAGFAHEPAIEITDNLIGYFKGNFEKLFFSDNGSTAVEVALKLAIQYWHNRGFTNKKKIVALDGGYHGDTFGAMSLGGKSKFFEAFNDYFFDVKSLSFPSNDAVVDEFEEMVKSGDVAAFVYEPLVQGSAGMRMYSAEILEKLLKVAKENDVLCVADEVMTGFGRTGELFASNYMDTKPDLMALSKGITGGMMAMGVTLISPEIVTAFDSDDKSKTFYHGHSYTANALACSVAVKSWEILNRKETLEKINGLTQRHFGFQESIKDLKKVKEVRCCGTIIAIEINTGDDTSYFNDIRDKLYQKFLTLGVLMRPLGNVIYLIPPYVITDEELTFCYSSIKKVLEEL